MAPFGLDFGRVGARFWEVLDSILEVSGDNLGIRLLLENLLFRSILLASGSGWAGGVTRSAKNLFAAMWDISVLCPRLLRIRPGGMREAIRRPSRDGVLNR